MLSKSAARIIRACKRAKRQGMTIPPRDNFFGLDSGVVAIGPGETYILDGKIICPLGAVLLGLERISDDTAYVFNDACHALKVTGQWVLGFLQASDRIRVNLPRKPNNQFSQQFIRGFNVGLEVLEWVNSQQKGA